MTNDIWEILKQTETLPFLVRKGSYSSKLHIKFMPENCYYYIYWPLSKGQYYLYFSWPIDVARKEYRAFKNNKGIPVDVSNIARIIERITPHYTKAYNTMSLQCKKTNEIIFANILNQMRD